MKSKKLRVPKFEKTMDNELVKILKAYAFERPRLQKKLKREPKSQEEGSRFLLGFFNKLSQTRLIQYPSNIKSKVHQDFIHLSSLLRI